MKTLLFDIEVSPNISYHWNGMHEQEIIEIIEEGYILCFAYKWFNEGVVKVFSLLDFKGDKESKKKQLVQSLYELFNEADVICGHNGNSFDIKWANREFLRYGLTPPSPYKQIDTLQIARSKFNFNSSRLNDLAKFLKIGTKKETGGFHLWKECMDLKPQAFKKMASYNKQDVVLLEKVFQKLVPFANTIPIMQDGGMVCPFCGSTHIQYRGYMINRVAISRRVQCQSCGRWSRCSTKVKINNKEYLL